MLSLPHTCKSSANVLWLWPRVHFFNPHTNEKGWWITTTVHTPHFPPIRMCRVYAPNSGHHKFITKILRVAADCELILSDFNFTTWYGDRSPPSPLNSEVIVCLNALSTAEYTDLALTGSSHNFTHHNRWYTACLNQCYSCSSPHFNRCFSTLHHFPTSHKNLFDYTHHYPPHFSWTHPKGVSFLETQSTAPHWI